VAILAGIDAASKSLHAARRWVHKFILSAMSSDALEYAVKNNVDPAATVVAKWHLDHLLIKPAASGFCREHWNGRDGIGWILSDVQRVYDLLVQNPVNREILKRREAIDWLNRAVDRAYNYFYDYCDWEAFA
jgi:hypothetical protein